MTESVMIEKKQKMRDLFDVLNYACQQFKIPDQIKNDIAMANFFFEMAPDMAITKFWDWKLKNMEMINQRSAQAFAGNPFVENVGSAWPCLDDQTQAQIWALLLDL